jgi:hypothetical protein
MPNWRAMVVTLSFWFWTYLPKAVDVAVPPSPMV